MSKIILIYIQQDSMYLITLKIIQKSLKYYRCLQQSKKIVICSSYIIYVP